MQIQSCALRARGSCARGLHAPLITLLCITLAGYGCSAEQDTPVDAATVAAADNTSTSADPNSLQAVADANAARELMPGRVHYERACVQCHDGSVQKAPHRDMIGLMTPEAILGTMQGGLMSAQASVLDEAEQREVAEYLAGSLLGQASEAIPACPVDRQFDTLAPVLASNWGLGLRNNRALSAAQTGLDSAAIARLQPLWSVKFQGANRVRSQPAFAGGLMFAGSHNGGVYALDPARGCQVWRFQASGEVRTAIVVRPWQSGEPTTTLYFGDVLGNVYALDARTGAQRWRLRADDHPNATITGTPTLVGDDLFIPISSLEVAVAVDPNYACCTFRGSVLSVDADSGETQWRTYTIAETPRVQKRNALGTDMIGPSGAVIWNSPSIDVERKRLYVGTGENMSSPATDTSDAIIAMDLDSGETLWTFQGTAQDAWNTACDTRTPENCPEENGPDFDFGAATMLVNTSAHGDLVIGGQKSGIVHALDPDTGAVVWQTRVGRGGIQGGVHFGMAAAHGRVYVPVSDMNDAREYPDPARPGMHALDANTGAIVWSTVHEDRCDGRAFCHPGISQAPTVIDRTVVAGAMDGTLRAYDADTGGVVWSLDTTQAFPTVDGTSTHGGSFGGAAGPIAFDGRLYINSGYGLYLHMPGNLLMALGPQ